jgi:Ser/Thr protein kinase RdoA (MazF antagonist)
MLQQVLKAYGFNSISVQVSAYGSGLINLTWLVMAEDKKYILQKINDQVFKHPEAIEYNINTIASFLQTNHPDYLFTAPVKTSEGSTMLKIEGDGYYRLFPFVKDANSIDVVETAAQAFEAASQFGRFTKMLSGLNIETLKTTIPSFHDLSLRYQQLLLSLENGNKQRIEDAATLIKDVKSYSFIVEEYEQIKLNPAFKQRVTHHDTKISNVLFDSQAKGLCVIDLDTVMPGYFISDVGDMMRTYLSPVSEEETDFEKIELRIPFYKAVVEGYYQEMKDELTDTEKKYFFYAGIFMVYMQAIRFLTDHFNDDSYYGAKYKGHNLIRAKNQMDLLHKMMDKQTILQLNFA